MVAYVHRSENRFGLAASRKISPGYRTGYSFHSAAESRYPGALTASCLQKLSAKWSISCTCRVHTYGATVKTPIDPCAVTPSLWRTYASTHRTPPQQNPTTSAAKRLNTSNTSTAEPNNLGGKTALTTVARIDDGGRPKTPLSCAPAPILFAPSPCKHKTGGRGGLVGNSASKLASRAPSPRFAKKLPTRGAEAALAAVHLGDPLLHRVQALAHGADAFHGGHMAPVHRTLARKRTHKKSITHHLLRTTRYVHQLLHIT